MPCRLTNSPSPPFRSVCRRIPTSTSSAAASGYCSEEEEGAEAAAADSSARSDTCSSAYTCSTASTASTASDSEDGDEACCKGSPLAGSGAPVGLRRLAAASAAVASASARGSVLQKQQPLGEPSVPLFEYMEGERPHLRLPLHDQILELAERCPELLTLDTRDLHPTSWLAVTWVPIYRIPSVPDPTASRDLQANFLTFHSLTVPAPRTHAAPADLCSIAPLPPLLDPIGEHERGCLVCATGLLCIAMPGLVVQGKVPVLAVACHVLPARDCLQC